MVPIFVLEPCALPPDLFRTFLDLGDVREAARWIFDRSGKEEHLRRQAYSLQAPPRGSTISPVTSPATWPAISRP